jgi:hypothetical protein
MLISIVPIVICVSVPACFAVGANDVVWFGVAHWWVVSWGLGIYVTDLGDRGHFFYPVEGSAKGVCLAGRVLETICGHVKHMIGELSVALDFYSVYFFHVLFFSCFFSH